MKSKHWIIIMFFLLAGNLAVAQETKMSAAEITVFKDKVAKESQNIKTLKTDFVQFKHMDFLEKDIESTGEMYFKTENTLKWKYNKPYNYSILFANNKVSINDQGNKSSVNMGSNKMFEKLNKLIVGTVNGNLFDDKEFTISYFKTKEYCIAKLVPKTEAIKKYIAQVDLYFPVNEYTVSQVKLTEPSKDYTRIQFKNKVINAKIDNSVFTL